MKADSCVMEILWGKREYAHGEKAGVGRAGTKRIGRNGKIIRGTINR